MSQKLCIPVEVLKQHSVTLGKTGAGKSSALRHIVEYLLRAGKRVCVVDPKGDWWGLKASWDGKGPGYPVIAFGDFKRQSASDVPINEHSGKHLAELITSGNRPCVIGLRGWMPGKMVRFWIEFASTLFNIQSDEQSAGELFLVGDEFHNFAPKGKIMDPESGKCLHWTNRMLSEGRGLGLVFLIASQRPQKVHNDTLTSCETLIAMRVIHEADREAVKAWIDGAGDKETGKQVLAELAGMPRGEAWVWSPEINFGPERVKFPFPFETFDSFAPPQLQKKVSQKGWADVDLEAVKNKLATVIEEAKANDPRELKRQIAELKRQANAAAVPSTTEIKIKTERVEVPVFRERDFVRFEKACLRFSETLGDIEARLKAFKISPDQALAALKREVKHVQTNSERGHGVRRAEVPRVWSVPRGAHVGGGASDPGVRGAGKVPVSAAAGVAGAEGGEKKLSKAERRILTALAQYPDGRTKKQVAVLAGYAMGGGGFGNALGALRSAGYVVGSGDELLITVTGVEALGSYEPLPTGRALFDYWMEHPDIGRAGREILRVLRANLEMGLDSMSKELIADQTISESGTPYEPGGGGFGNALGRLKTLELVEGSRDAFRLAEELSQ